MGTNKGRHTYRVAWEGGGNFKKLPHFLKTHCILISDWALALKETSHDKSFIALAISLYVNTYFVMLPRAPDVL